MSRKHFIALANALKATKPAVSSDTLGLIERAQWMRDVESIANACLAASDTFDYQRFMAHVKWEN